MAPENPLLRPYFGEYSVFFKLSERYFSGMQSIGPSSLIFMPLLENSRGSSMMACSWGGIFFCASG